MTPARAATLFWWLGACLAACAAIALPDDMAWGRVAAVFGVFVCSMNYGWRLAHNAGAPNLVNKSYVDVLLPIDFKPCEIHRCPCCKAEWDEPDVREPADAPDKLDFHCPQCTYRYARWPKNLC